MNFEKIIGWVLLFLGMAIIFYSLYSSFNIFTGAKEAPEIFKMNEKETILFKEVDSLNVQGQMERLIEKQLTGLLPADFMPKILNLIVWSMIAGILIFGGAQISGLGIKLIKK